MVRENNLYIEKLRQEREEQRTKLSTISESVNDFFKSIGIFTEKPA